MYHQEQFFKEQIDSIHTLRDTKEEDFERMQQEEREKVKLSITGHLNAEDRRLKYGFSFFETVFYSIGLRTSLSTSQASVFQ
jgi:hypothetical protein